ncbi:unnamed protein product [Ixodes hexagonus]
MQEISELLVAAGYFRARIKGLSPFDKIVGGLAWGIELCAVDIDVDLPFNENLNIGQKIALTEKIVRVLPKMKCPHRIEPHQIQGLDFEHIFPVVQWLVKKAIETKAETEDIHREYAVYLFEKAHGDAPQENAASKASMYPGFPTAYAALQERYRPRRRYRHHARHTLRSEELQVEATLLEYGSGTRRPVAAGDAGADTRQETEVLLSDMAPLATAEGRLTSKAVGNLVQMQAAEMREIEGDYESKPLLQIPGASRHERLLSSVKRQLESKQQLLQQSQDRLEKLREEYELRQKEGKEAEVLLQEAREATRRIAEGVGDQEPQLARLCALLRLGGELSDQESRFRQHCHQEMERLQADLAAIAPGGIEGGTALPAADPEDREADAQCQRDRDRLQRMRLLLAKKNREIAATQRKIDEVPSRAELSQYQRRFIELYTQVAATHRETKQFYTLYNTLDDIRMYLDKEVRIGDSAVLGRGLQHLCIRCFKVEPYEPDFKQFQKAKKSRLVLSSQVEKKRQEAKMSRDRLHDQFLELVDKQRLYFRTVKEFKEECRKNEVLVGKLKESSAK